MTPRLPLAFATLLAAGPALAATQAQGEAAGVRVWVRAGSGNALDTGALPPGAAGTAPLDYEVTTFATESDVALGSLARISAGPLRGGVRARLGRELSESTAAARALEVQIAGPSGILLAVAGAATTALVHCRDGARSVARDAELEGVMLSVRGQPVVLTKNPAPNTVVPLPLPGARLVLNEQLGAGGVETVNALHLTLENVSLGSAQAPTIVSGEVVVAHAAASLAACGSFVDSDADGRLDAVDNCPAVPNPPQRDTDRDGGGDACDVDDDADLVLDSVDTCPLEANPAQGACPDAVFASDFER